MAKAKTTYVCQECGWAHPKWVGQCQECSAWNSLVEEVVSKGASNQKKARPVGEIITPLSRVDTVSASKRRFSTTIGELDRVLGGDSSSQGMVEGAVVLIGGEPGIGKSTLLTQVAVGLMQQAQADGRNKPIVYAAGEENPNQIALRVARIIQNEQKSNKSEQLSFSGLERAEYLKFVTSTDVDQVVAVLRQEKPQLAIIDSIQTLTTEDLGGVAGSVGQVRESAERLTRVAKELDIPIFLVGHVTKEGHLAGPKVLEHIVDSVLELSGERRGDLRLLRAVKNRFGATDEVGVFRMGELGYESVENPSELFLEHTDAQVPGSATICVMEGTRPLLVEVQSLVVSSQLAMPRRVGRGVELSRLQVLSAVLQKHCNLPLGSADIFASVAGGFTVREPAVDLGLALAIVSSLKNKPLPVKSVFIGEIGLLGEVRGVGYLERRTKEAKRLGFSRIISRETHKTVRDVLKEFGLLGK